MAFFFFFGMAQGYGKGHSLTGHPLALSFQADVGIHGITAKPRHAQHLILAQLSPSHLASAFFSFFSSSFFFFFLFPVI